MRSKHFPLLLALVLISLLAAGCRAATTPPPVTSPVPTASATEAAPPQPTATITPTPARALVVCLATEPETLYLYGGSSRSMWSVLEAIYDGPFDTRGYALQPVILQKIPDLSGGDAVFQPAVVREGDPVVDVDGNLVALKAGVKVLPAGCSSPECAAVWDGQSELSMDQLAVTFKLLPGLKWSDGSPLTAADSVFSYTIAADPATPSTKYLTDRTASYTAVDSETVQWVGLPGFYEQRFGSFFWTPLPEHLLGSLNAEQIAGSETARRSPVGWGAYALEEWVPGDHITLKKNPNYFRASEGLPKFDTLVYRFVGEAPDGAMNALLAGECDVVDQNPQFLTMIPDLLQREEQDKLKTYVGQGPEWEHLDFGVRPSSYDDGYDPSTGDRVDLFGDARTRQAFAMCIDREKIAAELLYNRTVIPNSFVLPGHPLYHEDLPVYAYDPAGGQQLLDAVGWKDTDGNPDTPRTAAGVAGVPDGTTLSVVYHTTQAELRTQVAQRVVDSLRGCGIEASQELVNIGQLFSPGPDGPVFGRKFDLVQFSWEASSRPNCLLYTTSQTPSAANQWTGANVTGYSSPAFDAACAAATWARPSDADYTERSRQVQQVFAAELPVIPLYAHMKMAISRSDLCGLELDVTARSLVWNLEEFDYGPDAACK